MRAKKPWSEYFPVYSSTQGYQCMAPTMYYLLGDWVELDQEGHLE